MQIYSHLQMGDYHTNFCEDALLSISINNKIHLLAVMDGCSSGKESHFASTLIGKFLKKQAIQISYREFSEGKSFSLKALQKIILEGLFQDLKHFKNRNHLEYIELLSTLILGIFNTEREAEFIVVGDGLIHIDGLRFEFDQDDYLDYLAYHLDGDFEKWMGDQNQILSMDSFKDMTISSDGIFSFEKFNNQSYPEINEHDIQNYILLNGSGKESEKMLHKKVLHIEETYGLRPMDDLGILRVIF